MTPLIDGGAGQVGAALPWNWFALLAVLDLCLIALIVVRRRRGRSDGVRLH
jgi:hypothetical protein